MYCDSNEVILADIMILQEDLLQDGVFSAVPYFKWCGGLLARHIRTYCGSYVADTVRCYSHFLS